MFGVDKTNTRSTGGLGALAAAEAAIKTAQEKPAGPRSLEEITFNVVNSEGRMTQREVVREVLLNGQGGHFRVAAIVEEIREDGTVTKRKLIFARYRKREGVLKAFGSAGKMSFNVKQGTKALEALVTFLKHYS